MLSKKAAFKKALPVWAGKFENEMNISILFRKTVIKDFRCGQRSMYFAFGGLQCFSDFY